MQNSIDKNSVSAMYGLRTPMDSAYRWSGPDRTMLCAADIRLVIEGYALDMTTGLARNSDIQDKVSKHTAENLPAISSK